MFSRITPTVSSIVCRERGVSKGFHQNIYQAMLSANWKKLSVCLMDLGALELRMCGRFVIIFENHCK